MRKSKPALLRQSNAICTMGTPRLLQWEALRSSGIQQGELGFWEDMTAERSSAMDAVRSSRKNRPSSSCRDEP